MRIKLPKRVHLVVWFATLVALGSGLVNLYSVMGPNLPERHRLLRSFFPLEFLRLTRSLTLVFGFALVVLSFNIFKRKRRALQLGLAIALLSVFLQLLKGLDYEDAALSMLFAVSLFSVRRHFTVRSSIPDFLEVMERVALALAVVVIYGSLGLWVLEERQFGVNFHWHDAILTTLKFFALSGDPRLVPHTRYAEWFLDSMYLIGASAFLYSLYSIFRPVVHEYQTLPHEREEVRKLVEQYGRSSLDYFKVWPDKSYLFSRSRRSALAYRVGGNVALALADPVGPEEELEEIVGDFIAMCDANDWRFAFYQALPDFLPVYHRFGLKRLHLGQDAIVDLAQFTLSGKAARHLRNRVNYFEKEGYRCRWVDPPVDEPALAACKQVSDEWLQIPGRRERTFTLGHFDPDYLRGTPLLVLEDPAGRTHAFANIIPSYCKGEATIDLMRRSTEAPNGVMDYLLVKLFLAERERGHTRFNLGMAPLAGIVERADATAEERAISFFFQRLNFIFSNQGLQEFKGKFANLWEPRYIVYRSALHLADIGIALARVSKLHDPREEDLES
ncbi:MAG: bifunctional lysylphosphatidylglycerol flippase/synthetase MprF [Acidobacteria bacterium]|nr:bifunctional lysylphosphatidylglycerol flippase/synthetase MprF [Acidobacteriota bacterium]MBI3664006.1 bifunctional lysylphosphatidylglycerol flippase/synthetase MprF [Acidobacteriota bacterium]